MTLYERFLDNEGAPIHKNLHYFPIYERHFGRYVGRPLTMIEIGAGGGGSAQMWRRYFGPLAQIVSLDIDPVCKAFETAQVAVRIGDQADHAFLQSVLDEFGTPDIVLDDGSHIMRHVTSTFSYLYPKTASAGIYLIEDLHTAYWSEFGGGLREKASFIERSKDLIDELNADNVRDGLTPSEFTRTTISMTFYDSVLVFEKGRTPSKQSIVTGDTMRRFG